jgi:RimJ/RimL family protein N-acetyltransferase
VKISEDKLIVNNIYAPLQIPIEIITSRFILKSWDISHAPIYKNTIEETKDFLIPWMPWMPWAHGNEETIEEISKRLSIYENEHQNEINYRFGVYEQLSNKLIGECGLYNRVGENSIETGYWVHKDFLRIGVATEITSAMISIAFGLLNKEFVEIHCNANNKGSAAILKNLGFTLVKTVLKEEDYSDTPFESMEWQVSKDDFYKKKLNQIKIQVFNHKGKELSIID